MHGHDLLLHTSYNHKLTNETLHCLAKFSVFVGYIEISAQPISLRSTANAKLINEEKTLAMIFTSCFQFLGVKGFVQQ
jgi:hypothetical protein